jgi:AraC-like DNA-binding protein
MPDIYRPPVAFVAPEPLRQFLRAGMLDWDIALDRSKPLKARIALREAGDVRAMTITAHPVNALRGTAQIARDSASYVGLLYQQTGRTICRDSSGDVIAAPGEIVLWQSTSPLDFIMPERVRKLCMLMPADRFYARFPEVARAGCLHLRAGTNTVALLAGCLRALAETVFPRAEESASHAIDLTMDVLGAALLDRMEPPNPRAALFERITRFIDRELKDGALAPSAIARAHDMSVRTLHLLFSRRGMTVGGWIRQRRLEACRRELSDPRRRRTVTEIAFDWGFCDASYFSRAFKSAYGTSPSAFRHNRGEKRPA